ncbi:MAG: helix-turn-helix transcriptional regulator [Slackia sp.]|nr:helix-turn-helix transcriptional regulator [Slackia sp.]
MDCEKDERRASLLIPRFASVLVPALVGLSVFAFHMGVSRALVLDSISTETIGNIIASLALAPLCFVKSKRPVSVLLFSGAAPIVATALLACMGIANDINLGDGVVSTGIYTFFCMIAQISLALGIAGTHAREFTASMIWSGFLALFSAFSILGISLGGFLSNEQPFMPQAITALYCAYLVVQSVRSLWKNDSTSCSDGSKTNDEREGFSSRCEKLASEFSLSPRETEIVAYLGRGHTCSYIAKTLVISESTVYTHARNIYRKIGIGSKEDLVQILTK